MLNGEFVDMTMRKSWWPSTVLLRVHYSMRLGKWCGPCSITSAAPRLLD
jgi:hypothetical protein